MNGHGGARSGAGRPREDQHGEERRKHSIYCTQYELGLVRSYLKVLRRAAGQRYDDPKLKYAYGMLNFFRGYWYIHDGTPGGMTLKLEERTRFEIPIPKFDKTGIDWMPVEMRSNRNNWQICQPGALDDGWAPGLYTPADSMVARFKVEG